MQTWKKAQIVTRKYDNLLIPNSVRYNLKNVNKKLSVDVSTVKIRRFELVTY